MQVEILSHILHVLLRFQAGLGLSLLDSTPAFQPIPENQKHDKWIVVTTIQSPTEPIKKLSQMPGWRMVVVGDSKTPKDWR